MMSRAHSREMLERSRRSLAGGVSSNVRAGEQPPPMFFERGKGSKIYDIDGHEYVDYVLGQGPLILGHSPPRVLEAVCGALERGQLYAGQHESEVILSEKLQKIIPCAELVRYSNSGSEIVQAALRVARAYTGRQKYIKFEGHYHGWFDNVLVSIHPALDDAGSRSSPHVVPSSAGQARSVLGDVIVLPWNDLALLEETVHQQGDEIAAILMEPIMCNTGCILPQPAYLEGVRELCDQYGVVMILDEIITGFRVGLGGAQAYLGVTPDLATFGKAMAAGFPVSCLAGKQDLMGLIAEGKVNHSGTLNSNVMAMAAALATVEVLEGEGVYTRLYELGERLMTGIEKAAAEAGVALQVKGPGPMFHLAFAGEESIRDYRSFAAQHDMAQCHRFVELLLDEGVRAIPRGLWYLSTAHTEEDVDLSIEAVRSALQNLA